MSEKPLVNPKTLLCAGRVLDRNKKVFVAFIVCDEKGKPTDREIMFPHKIASRFNAGQTYLVDNPSEGKWNLSTGKWTESHIDEALVGKLQANDLAASVEIRSFKDEKLSGHNRTQLEHHVGALRGIYQFLTPAERIPFEVWLLTQLKKTR